MRLGRSAATSSQYFLRAAYATAEAGSGTTPEDEPDALRLEAFTAAQSVSHGGAGEALQRAAARASSGDAALQAAAGAWERAVEERAAVDRLWAEALGDQSEYGQNRSRELGARRDALAAEIAALEARLKSDFPAFFDLIRPEPVSVEELQADPRLLGADEALILLSPGIELDNGVSYPGIVFAVTREGFAWAEMGEGPGEMRTDIKALHEMLDTGNRAPQLANEATAMGARGYDRARAKRVYEALFASPEIAALISDKPDWVLVPQGELLSLPFAALVSGDYAGHDADPEALRATPWLGLERALAVVPSVSTLRTLRVLERPGRSASHPFFGVGDPDFEGAAGDGRGDITSTRSFFRDATGDVEAVRSLVRLPETRREIEELARALGADTGSYLLEDAASEAELRARAGDVGSARVVAFATHGLIAGDFGGSLAEPALALTPPAAQEGPDNDGLLTASEAATLRLSADWVILSACNTAAGGEPSAEGLTGLARAFFYAGADGLLVSHWRVRDDAAARLTTAAIRARADDPALSRAEALQAAMRALMNDTSLDAEGRSFANPAAWAPFQSIGVE